MEKFTNRVNEAAAKYLDRRGYEVIDEPWKTNKGMLPVELVCRDGDAVVFCTVQGHDGESRRSFDPEHLNRAKLEAFAIDWLTEHADEYVDMPFRFDVISLIVISELTL